jgi:hypothetical protein
VKVAEELAREGLLKALVHAVAALGPARVGAGDADALLRSVGLPIDLLAHFAWKEPTPIVPYVAAQLASGRAAAELADELARVPFEFHATIDGFRVATESGEHEAGVLRVHLTRGDDFQAPGDGGSLDIVRQLVRELHGASIVAAIEDKHLDAFLSSARAFELDAEERLIVLPEPWELSQWAQDNAKCGIVELGQARSLATLVPRYASRGEEVSTFVPGDTFSCESLALLGGRVEQSPLLFQGGNLIAVRQPKTGVRDLLVGEAELFRNMALGLTRDQVLAAMRAEFGVDRCIVLPAVSFHIDYELCVRAVGSELVAFVNDTSQATRLVLAAGIAALEADGALSASAAATAREDLGAGRYEPFVGAVEGALGLRTATIGHFPESFARAFARGAADSGVGNLQRVMLALDAFTAEQLGNTQPAELGLDPHATSYLFSFQRRERERLRVAQALQQQGYRIVPVPSTSEARRSLNTINGLHLPGRYLMPAYGGLFADFDRAALAAFRAALPAEVEVLPIFCGESQRRAGALHCAISIQPRL